MQSLPGITGIRRNHRRWSTACDDRFSRYDAPLCGSGRWCYCDFVKSAISKIGVNIECSDPIHHVTTWKYLNTPSQHKLQSSSLLLWALLGLDINLFFLASIPPPWLLIWPHRVAITGLNTEDSHEAPCQCWMTSKSIPVIPQKNQPSMDC